MLWGETVKNETLRTDMLKVLFFGEKIKKLIILYLYCIFVCIYPLIDLKLKVILLYFG